MSTKLKMMGLILLKYMCLNSLMYMAGSSYEIVKASVKLRLAVNHADELIGFPIIHWSSSGIILLSFIILLFYNNEFKEDEK